MIDAQVSSLVLSLSLCVSVFLCVFFFFSPPSSFRPYSDRVCQQPGLSLWVPFQNAATAVTNLYKGKENLRPCRWLGRGRGAGRGQPASGFQSGVLNARAASVSIAGVFLAPESSHLSLSLQLEDSAVFMSSPDNGVSSGVVWLPCSHLAVSGVL